MKALRQSAGQIGQFWKDQKGLATLAWVLVAALSVLVVGGVMWAVNEGGGLGDIGQTTLKGIEAQQKRFMGEDIPGSQMNPPGGAPELAQPQSTGAGEAGGQKVGFTTVGEREAETGGGSAGGDETKSADQGAKSELSFLDRIKDFFTKTIPSWWNQLRDWVNGLPWGLKFLIWFALIVGCLAGGIWLASGVLAMALVAAAINMLVLGVFDLIDGGEFDLFSRVVDGVLTFVTVLAGGGATKILVPKVLSWFAITGPAAGIATFVVKTLVTGGIDFLMMVVKGDLATLSRSELAIHVLMWLVFSFLDTFDIKVGNLKLKFRHLGNLKEESIKELVSALLYRVFGGEKP